MNKTHEPIKTEPLQELPKREQIHTRVLVPLERCVYEEIKNALQEFSKKSYAKVSVPQFLSRIIKCHWETDMAMLKGVDKNLKVYMSGEDPDVNPEY